MSVWMVPTLHDSSQLQERCTSPECATSVIARNVKSDVYLIPGFHSAQHIIGTELRRHVHAVKVEVRAVWMHRPIVRPGIEEHLVWSERVFEVNDVTPTSLKAQGWSGTHAVDRARLDSDRDFS